MTSSIAEFVEKHRGLERQAAYSLFLSDAQVKAAVERSPDLAERLRADFDRAWRSYAVAPGVAVLQQEVEEIGTLDDLEGLDGLDDLEELDALDAIEEPQPVASALVAGATYLCPGCARRALEPRLAGSVAVASCPECGWRTTDVLSLVPLEKTGPLAYVFGAGLRGLLPPVAAAAALAAAFVALRWLRI